MANLGPYWVGDKPLGSVLIEIDRDGSAASLSGYTSASVVLSDPTGAVIDSSQIKADLSPEGVVVTWPSETSIFTVPGFYTLQVRLNSAVSSEATALLTVEVRDASQVDTSLLASPAEVLSYTGVVVDQDDITRAQFVIETLTGLNTATVAGRDRRYSKLAVAYQAAWMQQHFDALTRADVTSISQDGGSYSPRDGMSLILAPLAKQALSNCSWSRRRTITPVASVRVSTWDPTISDDCQRWTRL